MVAVVLSWIYMTLVCGCIGGGVIYLLCKAAAPKEERFRGGSFDSAGLLAGKFSMTQYLAAGITTVTVYVEVFSIFGRIGGPAHILMLLAAALSGIAGRKIILKWWIKCKKLVFSWEGFFYAGFILAVAFFTSRGNFHTDTNIYHAQMIRLYEEYGIIKGMGNLQLHFAYNSAYLAFASILSLRWLLGQSLHTTTGFIEVIMCLYAFHGLKNFKRHRSHTADTMRVGILFYTLVMITGSISPATDYATMLFALFVITEWCENMESSRSITIYSLLSVLAVFVVTLKFSACFLVLIVLYPAVLLLREKRWREIAVYFGCGCLILLPFLVRNYLISGWLLYPFSGIDLFSATWKIPKEYLLADADQIKVWGRCLYDVDKAGWPVTRWFSVWWEGQERYEKMLLAAALIGAVMTAVFAVKKVLSRRKLRWDMGALMAAVFGSLMVWFFTAPFIRYGLAFLFALVMIAAGEYLSQEKKGFYSILTGGMMFCMFVSVSPYWDHYITDAGVFAKQNLKEPYYLWQKDYDRADEESIIINGNTIYYSTAGEVNSYHTFPGTCYKFMLERSTLIGDDIKDGFKAK